MTNVCEYAHCEKPAEYFDGAPGYHQVWGFCQRHYLEHRHLFWQGPWPHTKGTDAATRYLDLAPHGTEAAMARHRRADEPLCSVCLRQRDLRITDAGHRSKQTLWGAA